MSRRVVVLGATALAGGAGYYLYRAGGDPETAAKVAERDATKLQSKVKGELSGTGKEAEKEAKASASQLGSKVDSALGDAKSKGKELENQAQAYGQDAKKKLEEAKKETGNTLNTAVDKFDKTVEEGASKAKSGISSWFGGK